jgi:hypothetical protein
MTKLRPGEEIQVDPRRAMTPARKRRIHQACGGVCGLCGDPVPVDGPGVVYDHRLTLWIYGSDANKDIWPICKACDRIKTPQDQRIIAKIKRIQKKHRGEKKPSRRQINSKGFDTTVTKGLDGKVRPRKHHRNRRSKK